MRSLKTEYDPEEWSNTTEDPILTPVPSEAGGPYDNEFINRVPDSERRVSHYPSREAAPQSIMYRAMKALIWIIFFSYLISVFLSLVSSVFAAAVLSSPMFISLPLGLLASLLSMFSSLLSGS